MIKETNASDNLPLVALIGPTNAGKSTLFNRLTGSWQAVTAREESTTRDRIYGEVDWQGKQFNLVDTGGLTDGDSELYKAILDQTLEAAAQADRIIFLYDSGIGLSPNERQFLDKLRGKDVWLVANKVDTVHKRQKTEELAYLGFPFQAVSAATGKGVGDFLEEFCQDLPKNDISKYIEPLITLVGRPNVGKSTLLNALTRSKRAVVSPVAGTTRDIVTDKITIDNKTYLLADTAGVRKRGKISQGAEAFSVKRTLTAIAQSSAVIILVDASTGTARGDLHLIYYAQACKKPLLIVFNKADLVTDGGAPFHHHLGKFDSVSISALQEKNLDKITDWIKKNLG